MVLSWTKGRVFRRARKGKELNSGVDLEIEVAIPTHFRCPVTLDMMKDPVTVSTGITYDRDSIERWFESGNDTCPVTKTVLTTFDMIPNHSLRRMIQDWCVEHRSFGIERIPTPRIPVTPYEVTDTCTRILSGDENKSVELVKKIKAWGKESERNKRCIVSNGAPLALSHAFSSFSSRGVIEKHVVVLDEILGGLALMRPLSEECRSVLGSTNSVASMVWFINSNKVQLSTKQNAVLLLKEMRVEALVKSEGVVEGLVNMIKEHVGNGGSTKACLSTIFNLVSYNRGVSCERFVELGLVSVLLEILVDAERGVCEKALGVLDCVIDCKQGLVMAKTNALTLPLVIKKLLRVSELSSSFAVTILWKICDKTQEGVLIEALQMGVFHKLLVLLQVGCGEGTKEKATELLKLLNGCRNKAECVDSSLDFKHLKKPF